MLLIHPIKPFPGIEALGKKKIEFVPVKKSMKRFSGDITQLRYRPRSGFQLFSCFLCQISHPVFSQEPLPKIVIDISVFQIVNDIFLANLSGYWKIGRDDNQAVSATLRYFSLGEVTTGSEVTGSAQTLNPYEMSVDVGYSRKLSEKFSMGVVLRYIYSDLGFSSSYSGDLSTGASAFSADISGYYTTYPVIGRNECQWSWGWNVSNIGTKVSYDHGNDPAFLPTNLRLGTAFTFPLADYHNLTLGLDLNKLLVPTRPREANYDTSTPDGQREYLDALERWENMSPITGIFKSFS